MARGKRVPAGRRGGGAGNRHAARGSNDTWKGKKAPEDDPLRDLRPEEEDPEPPNPDGDEYIWPELQDENEDEV